MVPPCEPGLAQGFFLLKGRFSLPLCFPGDLLSGFLLSEKHLETVLLAKGAIHANKTELFVGGRTVGLEMLKCTNL